MAYNAAVESSSVVRSPVHPVPRLQAPFNESMAESVIDHPNDEIFPNAISRRNHLLEAPKYTRAVSGRWKQRPGEKYHPLWKLIAQISFGIHLLAGGLARSEDEVMQILQSHVDEIDGFLERTTEDLDLAAEDIQERLRCLKLPLSHPATFDKMLEDRNFRLSIVNGNEKIEHIAERTSQAMRDALKDVQKGFDATTCLESYMRELAQNWIRQSLEHEAVFVAMQGNVEGWRKAFMSLHIKGSHLGGSIKKLTDIINEMQKRAGEVSRKLLYQARGYSPTPDSQLQPSRPTTGRNTPTSRFAPNKDLPGMPKRPFLRAAGSFESGTSTYPVRTSSNDDPSHPTLSSRSSTPHLSQHLSDRTSTGRSTLQGRQNERDRINSVGTSILDSRASVRSSTTAGQTRSIDDEEPPERCFPPVELPAHVPEETMSKAPISKQNRLSAILKPAPTATSPKSDGKSHTSTLMGLLKSSHILSKSSANSAKSASISSIERSWMQSIAKPAEASNGKKSSASSVVSSSVSSETKTNRDSDTITDKFEPPVVKNNKKRKTKKGVKHWFDAMEDDILDDDKVNTSDEKGEKLPEAEIKTTVLQVPEKSPFEQNNIPGTPAWAATKFSSPQIRREGLKFGAFGSHPPQLPPGSPPLDENKISSPLVTINSRLSQPQVSDAAEPTKLASEATTPSVNPLSMNARPTSDDISRKRKSLLAPEVLSVQKGTKKPVKPLHFVAEMEGSAPSTSITHETGNAIAMELEAPQQYFRLPPRPNASCDLPLRDMNVASRNSAPVPQNPKLEDDNSTGRRSMPLSDVSRLGTSSVVKADLVAVSELADNTSEQCTHEESSKKKKEEAGELPGEDKIVETQLLLPATTYIPTPQIPLPPSPLDADEPKDSAAEGGVKSPMEEVSFLLPAVAYKAPASEKRLSEKTLPDQDIATTKDLARFSAVVISTVPSTAQPSTIAEEGADADGQVVEASPTSTGIVTATFSEFVARGPPPLSIISARSRESSGSHNGWKAFFTGQPSPASSSLTIRSIRRESLEEVNVDGQQSPGFLSPSPGGSRFLSSPTATSVRDSRIFGASYDREKEVIVRDMLREQDEKTTVGLGLGIQAISVQQD